MKQLFMIILISVSSLSCMAGQEGFATVTTTLAVADTRQPLMAVPVKSNSYLIQNLSTNTDSIFIGSITVTTSGATVGIELVPGAALNLESSQRRSNSENFDPSKIYMISAGTAVPVVIGYISDRR